VEQKSATTVPKVARQQFGKFGMYICLVKSQGTLQSWQGKKLLSFENESLIYHYKFFNHKVLQRCTRKSLILCDTLCPFVVKIYFHSKKYGIVAGAGSRKYTVTQPDNAPILLSSYPKSIHLVRGTPNAVSIIGPPPVSPIVASPYPGI